MPYYVKVTPKVREKILPDYVNKPKSKDGNYLLFQADLIGVEGNTLQERVDHVGGALLTPDECKAERLGTVETPAECYTPAEYGGESKQQSVNDSDTTESELTNGSLSDGVSSDVSQTVIIPPVIAEAQSESTDTELSSKKESEVDHE